MPEENENLDQEKYTLSAPADPGNTEPLQILAPEEKTEENEPAVKELPPSGNTASDDMPLLEKADPAEEEKLPESFRKEEPSILPLSEAEKKEEAEEFLLPLEDLEPEKDPHLLRKQAPVLSGTRAPVSVKPAVSRKSITLPLECGSSLGELLKEARKMTGLAPEEVMELTKIQKETLLALENNALDSLPPLVFVAAYARTLQDLYVLDPASRERVKEAVDKLMHNDREEDYAGGTPEMKNKILKDISSTAKVNVEEERRFRMTAFCVLGGAVFFFILVTILILFLVFGGKKAPAEAVPGDLPPFRAENINTLIPDVIPEIKKMELPEGAIVSVKPAGKKPGKRARR